MPKLTAREHEERGEALSDLRAAVRAHRAADAALREAVRQAHRAGISLNRIAAVAGCAPKTVARRWID